MPDDLSAHTASTSQGTGPGLDLLVEGMSCASCVRRVERALTKVPGVESAQANFATGHTRVRLRPGADPAALEEALDRAVEKAGYAVLHPEPEAAGATPPRHRMGWLRPTLAGLLALPFLIGMIGMGLGRDWMPPPLAQFVLATLMQFGIGAGIYRKAWGAVRDLTGNMELLVAIGTTAAWALSTVLMLNDGHHLYFEASALVLAFVSLGRFLEERARNAAAGAVETLLKLRPDTALRLDGQGREEEVPTARLRQGDRIAIRPGARIPADALLEEGEAGVDESALTGESRAVAKSPGDALAAGTVVLDGRLVARVTATGKDTRLARIAALVEEAGSSRAPIQRLADRVSAVFVPVVLGIAAVTFLGWLLAGAAAQVALLHAVAVLVVACPCALGLATPAAVVAGTGAAARAGILLRDAEAIERARGLSVVAFDKTGTLTEGRPRLAALVPAEGVAREEALRLAARLQAGSEHPLARAVLDEAGGTPRPAESFRALPGRGVEGVAEGRRLRLGSDRLLPQAGAPEPLAAASAEQAAHGYSQSWLIESGPEGERVLALLGFEDAPRAGAAEAVARLHALGLRTAMLSGDNEAAAREAARRFGIDEVAARLLPEDKATRLAAWHAEGRRVAMVGDGVNDAPALAAADLGIAMGGGTDAAFAAAHLALLRPDPRLVPAALSVLHATWRTIAQNLGWAFAFNTLAIPAAALGGLSPALAGGAMALSSLTVLGNALRLTRWKPEGETAHEHR
ncbi:Copper-exporting ATPase [Roseomonas mucosa]|nr:MULTISPECIES: cation-translocating P-type ATPase [Roseomonas]MDT8277741.1 cation-translocating P-type ATPase [Roseomonas mucosa]MDT8355875.1 cation-translocating P-type ATPase [Roseomonas mucosa]MDU7520264.1 cation-translocating P-type ATPase [Roseomonas mucosa]UZO95601.1 Copper-exporting ATPase [Roseomonas mucosa]